MKHEDGIGHHAFGQIVATGIEAVEHRFVAHRVVVDDELLLDDDGAVGLDVTLGPCTHFVGEETGVEVAEIYRLAVFAERYLDGAVGIDLGTLGEFHRVVERSTFGCHIGLVGATRTVDGSRGIDSRNVLQGCGLCGCKVVDRRCLKSGCSKQKGKEEGKFFHKGKLVLMIK